MIACLACYHDRLASLYDTAADFLLFEVEADRICPVGRLSLPQRAPTQRITAFAAHGVSLLVCGGICRRDLMRLAQAGIRVAPWVCGEPDAVLAALQAGRLEDLRMPGCGRDNSRPLRPEAEGRRRTRQRGCPSRSPSFKP